MKRVIIFHGTGGSPQENWFPWLKNILQERGIEVVIPQFPTPQHQTLENWHAVMEPYLPLITPETVLIGHSLGGAFLLRVMEKLHVQVEMAILVAPTAGVLPIKYYEGDKPFVGHPFDWDRIELTAQEFVVFHSKDDPFVAVGNGELVAQKLRGRLIIKENAGHFNAEAGYTEFPEILEYLPLN